METLTDLLPLSLIAFSVCVTLVAGIVKGAIGFAMPLIMISGMGMLLDPVLVVAGLILPIVVSNSAQVLRAGPAEALEAIREYWIFILLVCVMILVSAQFLTVLPTDTMFLIIGFPVVLICAIQLAGLKLVLPVRWRRAASVVAGLFAGTIGGLAGTWGPPTVLYLVAIEAPKQKQIVVQGVIYGLGSVMLLLGHLRSGVLNGQTVWFSALLLVPALVGLFLGFRIQDRIDQQTFRKATLVVLLLAGLNLVRRGLF